MGRGVDEQLIAWQRHAQELTLPRFSKSCRRNLDREHEMRARQHGKQSIPCFSAFQDRDSLEGIRSDKEMYETAMLRLRLGRLLGGAKYHSFRVVLCSYVSVHSC
jgi:hypothetical protein